MSCQKEERRAANELVWCESKKLKKARHGDTNRPHPETTTESRTRTTIEKHPKGRLVKKPHKWGHALLDERKSQGAKNRETP